MARKDQRRRPAIRGANPEATRFLGSREDRLITLAGVLIAAGVLYEVYWRQSQ